MIWKDDIIKFDMVEDSPRKEVIDTVQEAYIQAWKDKE